MQILWQCGKYYEKQVAAFMQGRELPDIRWSAFIDRMDYAYAAADLIVSRSGASSVSEICACGKACIFVPSPNVAEDHQRHNAMALVSRDAAEMVADADAPQQLMDRAMALVHDRERLAEMERNAASMALPDAAAVIVDCAYSILK